MQMSYKGQTGNINEGSMLVVTNWDTPSGYLPLLIYGEKVEVWICIWILSVLDVGCFFNIKNIVLATIMQAKPHGLLLVGI